MRKLLVTIILLIASQVSAQTVVCLPERGGITTADKSESWEARIKTPEDALSFDFKTETLTGYYAAYDGKPAEKYHKKATKLRENVYLIQEATYDDLYIFPSSRTSLTRISQGRDVVSNFIWLCR